MRGVPHLLGMRLSVDSVSGPRTGWSGDGVPDTCPPVVAANAPERCDDFDRSLRAFALGAVIQHFPKTLVRIPNQDFQLPTDAELDALEAFQLSLGRQQDLQLPLPLKGTVAKRGQEIFLDDSSSKCNRCHKNAGANVSFGAGLGNLNFDTGVEQLPDQPGHLTGEPVPADDGFGTPGNETFNTTPLVEAADTGPFFHNNSIETIEGAVAFYNDEAFNSSPGGLAVGGIRLAATQVVAVAAFLRVLNAIQNIDTSIDLLRTNTRRTFRASRHEVRDAINVLQDGGLHPQAVVYLERAQRLLAQAPSQEALAGIALRVIGRLKRARSELIQ